MVKNYSILRSAMSPDHQANAARRAKALLRELPLHELRQARRLSQEALATILGASQPSISKLESRTDLYVSTLRSYIEAMGGVLEIRARFPDGEIAVTNFASIEESAVKPASRSSAKSVKRNHSSQSSVVRETPTGAARKKAAARRKRAQ